MAAALKLIEQKRLEMAREEERRGVRYAEGVDAEGSDVVVRKKKKKKAKKTGDDGEVGGIAEEEAVGVVTKKKKKVKRKSRCAKCYWSRRTGREQSRSGERQRRRRGFKGV